MSAATLTKWEGARWFEEMKREVLASVAESNRLHVLTAYRVMAWEDLAWGRPFGVARLLLLGFFRPAALHRLILAKQNATMASEMDKAKEQMQAKAKAAFEDAALDKALKDQGGALFAVSTAKVLSGAGESNG